MPRALPLPIAPPEADSRVLAAILDELRGLRRDLAARHLESTPATLTPDVALGNLLRAIAAAVGDHLFTCSDLLLRVPPPADAPLRKAIVLAVGTESPRRVGKLLRRYEGVDVEGLRVVRVGVERDGVAWQVVACLRV